MSALAVETPVTIRLEDLCSRAGRAAGVACAEFAGRLKGQLADYTQHCSVLELGDPGGWLALHRTARRRRGRALARGYRFAAIERAHHVDDIHAINTSLEVRQGRPMADGYRSKWEYSPLGDQCERHAVHCYGVFAPDDPLVAYAYIYRCGELALVSSILGHGDHLADEIMYLLVAGIVDAEADQAGWLFYNRHDSGTEGLRFFKERCGFEPRDVSWQAR